MKEGEWGPCTIFKPVGFLTCINIAPSELIQGINMDYSIIELILGWTHVQVLLVYFPHSVLANNSGDIIMNMKI